MHLCQILSRLLVLLFCALTGFCVLCFEVKKKLSELEEEYLLLIGGWQLIQALSCGRANYSSRYCRRIFSPYL